MNRSASRSDSDDAIPDPLLSVLRDGLRLCPRDLVVAHSAGLDSSVLLHALATLCREQGRALRALHVHHGWFAEADDWQALSRAQAQALGVPWSALRVIVRNQGEGMEAAARVARYQALFQALAANEVLVTAHHRDDQAETLLSQLLRGAGIDGLGGMASQQRILRPLLPVSRVALERYARHHGIAVADDPSNRDARFQRAWLRHDVLPQLEQRWPEVRSTLARTAAHLRADAETLRAHSLRALAHCRSLDSKVLRCDSLTALPAAEQARVLKLWLEEQGARWPVRLREQVLVDLHTGSFADGRQPQWRFQDGCLQRYRDLLSFSACLPAAAFDLPWHGKPQTLPNNLGRIWLEPQVSSVRWRIHSLHGGESLRVHGKTREVRKLLQALAIPPWQRPRLTLISDHSQCLGILHLALGDALRSWLHEHHARLCWAEL